MYHHWKKNVAPVYWPITKSDGNSTEAQTEHSIGVLLVISPKKKRKEAATIRPIFVQLTDRFYSVQSGFMIKLTSSDVRDT